MASGFFLGGLAEGAQTAAKQALAERQLTEDTGLRGRALAIQESAEKRAGEQQFLERGDKMYADFMGYINEAVKSAVAVGTPPEAILPKIQPMIDRAETFGQKIGRPPGEVQSKVAAMFTMPGAVTTAAVKGRATAVETVEEALERKRALTPGAAPGAGAGVVRGAPAPGVMPAPGGAPGQPPTPGAVSAPRVTFGSGAAPGFSPPAPPPPTLPALTEADLIKYKDHATKMGIANTLREDYFKHAKDFITVRDFKNRIDVTEKTGAGDLALVFSYMKMLDPPSTVREGEQASVRNAAGVPETIMGMYNKLIGGGQLSNEARKQVLSQAEKLYQAQARQHDKLVTQFANKAQRNGIEVKDVVFDLYPAAAAPASAPVTGRTPSGIPYRVVP